MALTWEKWLELYQKSPDVGGGVQDITHLVTPENYNDISFWRENPGITICFSQPENSASAPFEYGLILTTVIENNDVSQIFYTQPVGSIMRRSGNVRGWNGKSDVLGQNAWSVVMLGDIRLDRHTNLDNITSSGFYYCPTSADVNTISNTPRSVAFSLVVVRSTLPNGCVQLFFPHMAINSVFYMRKYSDGVMGSWFIFTGATV